MTIVQTRKRRWSTITLFSIKSIKRKVSARQAIIETADGTADPQPITDNSFDTFSTEEGDIKPSAAVRIQRSGSKLLSIIGIQSRGHYLYFTQSDTSQLIWSSDTQSNKNSSSVPSERDIALAIVKEAANPSRTNHASAETLAGLYPLGILKEIGPDVTTNIPQFPSPSTTVKRSELSSVNEDAELSHNATRSELIPVDIQIKRKDRAGLRKSLSIPGLSHQLSHKLSTTFGNPTIVHRPDIRTRPSIHSIRNDPIFDGVANDLEISPGGDTDPSSFYNSSSMSPRSPSTGKTSLESNIVSLHSRKSKEQSERVGVDGKTVKAEETVLEKPLTPIEEAPYVASPTIVTVETTANAKIFFETHFNSILSGQVSPRSLRRRELEMRLQAEQMSAEQRQMERCIWAAQESDHLRQTRVLRAQTNEAAGSSGVSVAGYEVVKILGKGSFGVVRLVREKEILPIHPASQSQSSVVTPSWRQTRGEELSGLKKSATEALKSTLDNQKVHYHRESKKLKREVYALKVIRKSEMLRNSQEGHLRAERDFLVTSENSRWVVPLIASFQDNTNLYLVMEYMVGGDFLGLLFRMDTLKEKKARWYIAEMILCVEEAHKLRWIHRDVKPDNFLISASGHLKIADFGLAFDGHWAHDQSYFNNHRQTLMEKLGIRVEGDSIDRKEGSNIAAGMALANILAGRRNMYGKPESDGPNDNEGILQWRNRHGKRKLARSVVGTSQYMAPEVIRGELYDGRCDWWSIGIILYEVRRCGCHDDALDADNSQQCLYGYTPFVCENRQDTKIAILVSVSDAAVFFDRADPLTRITRQA